MRAKPKSNKAKPVALSQLRVIGGQWRSRKLSFPTIEGLRPTPDRVRETLFNWLQNAVPGARCLDLFAGSGALGIEALSRGAAHCNFVDINSASSKTLKENLTLLKCQDGSISQSDTAQWLKKQALNNTDQFDLVFLDPPFNKGFCQPLCQQLTDSNLLSAGAYVYVETEPHVELNTPWRLHREKLSGQVHYRLYQVS